jgi:iron complex transport system ATP-binding protein
LRHGRAIASGPIDEALTASSLSECFGIPLGLDKRDGRWSARALPG